MKRFKSIEEVKRVAEHFNAGTVIPARVLKGQSPQAKKFAHNIVFGRDMYRIQAYDGTSVLVSFVEDGDCCIMVKKYNHGKKPLRYVGNPYGAGVNRFIVNDGISEQQHLEQINLSVFEKLAGEL